MVRPGRAVIFSTDGRWMCGLAYIGIGITASACGCGCGSVAVVRLLSVVCGVASHRMVLVAGHPLPFGRSLVAKQLRHSLSE
jgi:hypothetical protein